MNIFLLCSLFLSAVTIKASQDEIKRNVCYRAVIKRPIVDMNNSFPAPKNPAASPDTKGCDRAHQGLFNEMVNCLEEHNDQVKVAIDNIVYGFDINTKNPLNTFWTYKKNIIPTTEINNDLLLTIPNQEYGKEPTVVLTYPWQQFSVGTRFRHIPEYDSSTAYAIARADFQTDRIIFDYVSHEHALPETVQDPKSARTLFVATINNLIDKITENGSELVIPYIWGGSSFVELYSKSDFYKNDGTWQRTEKTSPYSGYDCSEFVMRMAKIAGIEFPWKTSTAIQRSKRELNEYDQLEEGDLIWTPGHVMIVSSIANNELIEARGYSSGYGSVHRATLAESFDAITSYYDLLERYYSKQPIKYKDKQGNVVEKPYELKLLKLID